jgi:hypothetical protein
MAPKTPKKKYKELRKKNTDYKHQTKSNQIQTSGRNMAPFGPP